MLKCLILSMVPDRDWYIDEQICREIEKLGHKAVLRKFLQDGRDAVMMERPDVVLLPVVRCPYTRDFALRLKSWGIKVVARRSEAGVSGKMYKKMSRSMQINQIGRYDYNDCVDMELVWGLEFAEVLVDEGKIDFEKIRLIGGISLDAYLLKDYGQRVAELAGDRDVFIRENNFNPDKKTLFWACGFKLADVNPDYTLPEAEPGDPIHRELYRKDVNGREVWIDAIKTLFARYKDKYNFFVRPHPGEMCSKYTEQFPEGISVSLKNSAAWGMNHCDVLIHAGSTLAVDAHVLNKPAFNFYNAAEDNLIGNVSPKCGTVDELDKCLENIEFGKSNANIKSLKELERFYGVIDGCSCERVALAVSEFAGWKINTHIPDRWPDEEISDFTSDGVIKLSKHPIIYCSTCKKPFQITNGQRQVPCPHCGIAIRINEFVCV